MFIRGFREVIGIAVVLGSYLAWAIVIGAGCSPRSTPGKAQSLARSIQAQWYLEQPMVSGTGTGAIIAFSLACFSAGTGPVGV